MTRLESQISALRTARRAQAVVDAHLERERARANLETRYLEALSAYLTVRGALTCQREPCGCRGHRELQTVLEAYRVAWSQWRGA